jgi:hypothetical protein
VPTKKRSTSKKAASTKKAAAPKLSALQKRLNDNTRLRTQFLKDPGGVLSKEGIELTPAKAAELARFTQQVTTAPAKQVTVDSIQQRTIGGASARSTRVEVEVSFKVRF